MSHEITRKKHEDFLYADAAAAEGERKLFSLDGGFL
jgi:hypothetical protein